jgi:dihydroorotate dehydrogenase electron transfer subunit
MALITVQVGRLAALARPGHFLIIDLLDSVAQAVLLRSAHIAAADAALGTVELWCAAADLSAEWPQLYAGLPLTIYGLFGTPLTPPHAAQLLLVGSGPALAPLFFLAAQPARSSSTVLVPLADGPLPPLQRLPADVEVIGGLSDITALAAARLAGPPLLNWADQVYFALPFSAHPAAAQLVRNARLRWEAGFARFITPPQARCTTGVCRSCRVTTRRGARLLCRDGPLFDLRDL